METKTEGVKKAWQKYKIVALVMALGALLLLWPGGSEREETGSGESLLPAESGLQREMEEILSNIQGVGQVKVLLTMDSDGERQLAQDTEVAYSGTVEAPEDYSRTSSTVLLDGEAGDESLVVRTVYPTYRGALVVCSGGGEPSVKLTVTEAVAALTGLKSDCITVAKWQ